MGLSKGSIGYIRLVAMGDIPEQFEEPYTDALLENQFRDLDAQSDEEVVHGWVRLDDPLSTQFKTHELVQTGPVIPLCLRIDTLKVPAATLRAHVKHREKKKLAEFGRPKLTRAEKEQIRTDVRRNLRSLSLPKMQLAEAIWNLGTGELRLISTSKSTVGFFIERFEKTFGLNLNELGPRGLLWMRGFTDDELARLGGVEPERFHLHVNPPRSVRAEGESKDAESPDPESPDPESPDPESPDPESPDPGSPDPGSPDPESPDPEGPDPGSQAGQSTDEPAPEPAPEAP